jgi:xanthine dehydrogenase YagS FAD-binding subunit
MEHFEYLQPKTIKDASKMVTEKPEKTILYSGGTDVLGMIKDHLIFPEQIINLKSIPNLDKIEYTSGKGLRIGALTKLTEISHHDLINKKYSVLAQAAKEVASPQLRNIGTIGGNICQRPRCWYFRGEFNCLRKGGDICYAVDGENKYHCIIGGAPCFIVHPSDTAVALLALDAVLKIFNGKKYKEVPINEFFILPETEVRKENILEPGDIITEIMIPDLPSNTKSTFIKIKERQVWDFALVSLAAVIRKSGNQIISGKVAFGGVAPAPWIEKSVNQKLAGLNLTKKTIDDLAELSFAEAIPLEQNEYKIIVARNLLKKALIDMIPG